MTPDLPAELRRELDATVAAHRALVDALVGLDEAAARRPSLLPGWSIGHVLSHLARNADGMTGMLEAAAHGDVAAQYPGGGAQRDSDIEAGAGRPADELVGDVADTAKAWEAAAAALTAEQWATGRGASFAGTIPIAEVPFRRRREVVVHHSDLGLGGAEGWRTWPAEFVQDDLVRMTAQWVARRPRGRTALPPEALAVPDEQRLAWLLGRAAIDGLAPAGVF